MAPATDTQDSEPVYVVWKIEAKANGLWAVYVQMPDRSNSIILVPSVGVSFAYIRLAATVVAQLWDTKRGATRSAEVTSPEAG